MTRKSGTNWRQILKFEKVDGCLLAKGINMPFLVKLKERYDEAFPNLPRNCPIKVQSYVAQNISVIENQISEFNMTLEDFQSSKDFSVIKMMTPKLLPNGIYRHSLRVFNDDDMIGMGIFVQLEINHRMNDEEF